MTGDFANPLLILLVGLLLVMNMLLEAGSKKLGLPSLVGFLLLGFGLRITHASWNIPPVEFREILEFLGRIGIITLLFRIGLESRPAELLKKLPQASLVAILGIILSGSLGFWATYYLLKTPLISSLVLATAMTATSVGISVGIWQNAGKLQSPSGQLLLDVAELDDIAAILLMAMLFSILPVLQGNSQNSLFLSLGESLGISLLKLIAFAALCLFFSFYLEKPLSRFARRVEPPPAFMLVIAGCGIILASIAEWFGFSLAIGAFFAGLVFSRDPQAVKKEGFFLPLYDFFSPFFFIHIGFQIDPTSIFASIQPGMLLLLVAVIGKTLAGLPVLFVSGYRRATLMGLSLVPRAEIALVIITRALQHKVLSQEMFSAMVLVFMATCLLAPISLRLLMKKWPQAIT